MDQAETWVQSQFAYDNPVWRANMVFSPSVEQCRPLDSHLRQRTIQVDTVNCSDDPMQRSRARAARKDERMPNRRDSIVSGADGAVAVTGSA